MKLYRIIFLLVMLAPAFGFAMNPEMMSEMMAEKKKSSYKDEEMQTSELQEKTTEILAQKIKNLEYRVKAIEALLSKQEPVIVAQPAKPTVIETKQEEDTLKQLMKVLQLYMQEKGEPSKPAKTEESNYVKDLKSLINTFLNK